MSKHTDLPLPPLPSLPPLLAQIKEIYWNSVASVAPMTSVASVTLMALVAPMASAALVCTYFKKEPYNNNSILEMKAALLHANHQLKGCSSSIETAIKLQQKQLVPVVAFESLKI